MPTPLALVCLLPPPFEIPRLVLTMQWRNYRTQDPGMAWLRERLHEAARCIDQGERRVALLGAVATSRSPAC